MVLSQYEYLNKKLNWKRLGLFTVTQRIGIQAYKLELLKSIRIHPGFHVSLLEPYHASDHAQKVPSPPVIINDNEPKYEVEDILDSKLFRRRLFYLVKWKDYLDTENYWEPAAHLKNIPLLIKCFHLHYPSKPGPTIRTRT